MSTIIQIFEVYIRKRSPKDINYDESTALLLVFISIAISTVAISVQPYFKTPLITAVTAVLLGLGINYAILSLHQKTSRFVQMITALIGIDIITTTVLLPIINVAELGLLASIIRFWGLYLSVLVLKETLESSFFKSLAITFASTVLLIIIVLSVFADTQALEQLKNDLSQDQQSEAR